MRCLLRPLTLLSPLFVMLAVAIVSVSGCATAPTAPVVASTPAASPTPSLATTLALRASVAVDDLVRLNAIAQRGVAIFLPWLTPAQAERVRAGMAMADAAIARVSQARDLAGQAAAIDEAKHAIAGFKWLAGH